MLEREAAFWLVSEMFIFISVKMPKNRVQANSVSLDSAIRAVLTTTIGIEYGVTN
jgi:hypothetical protein